MLEFDHNLVLKHLSFHRALTSLCLNSEYVSNKVCIKQSFSGQKYGKFVMVLKLLSAEEFCPWKLISIQFVAKIGKKCQLKKSKFLYVLSNKVGSVRFTGGEGGVECLPQRSRRPYDQVGGGIRHKVITL